MKRLISIALFALTATASLSAAPSILDVKHTITDENIVPPGSFETKAIDLEASFYLRNYSADSNAPESVTLASPEVYTARLAALPTEIEMPYNDVVRRYIEMYLNKRARLVSDMLALHNYYGPIFVEELERQNMPLELQYLPVIESALNPNAVSRAGAAGLWQFMPGTAKGLGMEVNSLVDNRRAARESSKLAATYLKQLYNIYNDWSLAIAAYNCGPGNVNKAIKRAGGEPGQKKDFWEIYYYLPSETRGYIPAFIAANYVMNYADKHGIKPRVVKQPLVTDTVTVNDRLHFNQISAVLNIPVEEIRMLNPQFRKDIIPGNNHPYTLTLPAGQVLSYVVSEKEIFEYDRDKYSQRLSAEPGLQNDNLSDTGVQPNAQQSENAAANVDVAQVAQSAPTRITHVVGRGESLRDIAKRYNVSAGDIKHWNSLRRAKVKEGDQLIIETYDHTLQMPDMAQATPAQNSSNSTNRNAVPAPAPKVKEEPAAVPAPAPRRNNAQPEVASRSNNRSNASATQPSASETKSQKAQRRENAGSTQASAKTKNNKAKNNDTASKNSKNNSAKSTSKKQAKQKDKEITIKNGDNLEKLAKANGVTVDDIRKANGIKGDKIKSGDKLKIPAKSSSKSSNSKASKSGNGSKSSKSTTSSSKKKKR